MHPSPSIELLRLDPDNNQDIPLPRYMTAQSSGMDICAVLNDDGITVTALACAVNDLAITGCLDRRSGWCRVINTLVRANLIEFGMAPFRIEV